jgi:cell division septation protein DedD
MSPNDYVSRGQKRNNKKSAKKAPTPWLRITAALCLVSAFIFGLYHLQKTPTTQVEAELEADIVNIADDIVADDSADRIITPKIEGKEPLPTLGKEEWAFIDALPEYSVEIDVPEEEKSVSVYILQCGSFRTTERAQELRATLALQGLEAQILRSEGNNGIWYRVVLGPYDGKREAERHRHQVRRAGIDGCKIY